MDTIKDRNSRDITEAEEEVARICRRATQMHLHDPDNHDGVIAHLEPDILEWALESQVGLWKHHYKQS